MSVKRKKEHSFWHKILHFAPYLATAALIFGIAAVGSEDKTSATTNLNMSSMASGSVSADQLSELYVVASLSSSMNLASVDTVSGNYVAASVLRQISQTSTDRIEKPGYVPVNNPRGVETYVVQDGDTMELIAARKGLTTDQIRWSNGLKTTEIAVGQALSLPTTPGIVYTVKSGDTVESLASRYGSRQDEIVIRNDLENSALVVGSKILLPGGTLPQTERPEYVPTYTYSYYGASSSRLNLRVISEPVNAGGGNRMYWGQCTFYAWWWRWANGMALPTNYSNGIRIEWGNANNWAYAARTAGMAVDGTPSYGAIFQTPSGWYGHVGIVIRVNDDGSLLVREMNYASSGVITESTIPASIVGSFSYIH